MTHAKQNVKDEQSFFNNLITIRYKATINRPISLRPVVFRLRRGVQDSWVYSKDDCRASPRKTCTIVSFGPRDGNAIGHKGPHGYRLRCDYVPGPLEPRPPLLYGLLSGTNFAIEKFGQSRIVSGRWAGAVGKHKSKLRLISIIVERANL